MLKSTYFWEEEEDERKNECLSSEGEGRKKSESSPTRVLVPLNVLLT